MRRNNKKMSTMVEKTFKGMELFSEIVKNSIVFWLYFIRGLGFLTMIPTIESLTFVSLDVLNKERIDTKENFKRKYYNTNKKRLFSILLFFFWLYSFIFILVPVPEQSNGSFAFTLKFILISVFILQFILLITKPLLEDGIDGISWSLSIQIFLLVKEIKWTIFIFLGLVIVGYLSITNFIFLIFVSPGVSGLIVSFGLSKAIKNIQINYFN